MKSLHYYIVLILTLIFSSCVDEKLITPNASFRLSNQTGIATEYTCYVGETFYVVKKGDGEFLTLFDGMSGKVWGESGSLGVQFQLNDSLPVTYTTAGEYNLTVVASSSAKFGEDLIQDYKTVKMKVIDRRNAFTGFSLFISNTEYKAIIDNKQNVTISIPDVYKDSIKATKPLFFTSSSAAEVLVNNQKQISGINVLDLSNTVVYKVLAPNGNYLEYNVKVDFYKSSSEKGILQFKLTKGGTYGNGEEGVIDEVNKTITINLNYATPADRVKVEIISSVSSTYWYNGTSEFGTYTNLSTKGTNPLTTIKVKAQDMSETSYSVIATSEVAFKTFTFKGFNPAPISIIDNLAKTITVKVLKGTDITKLVAEWNGTVGKVRVGNGTTNQVNGTTVNDFSTPKQYKLYKGTSSNVSDTYTVIVVVLE